MKNKISPKENREIKIYICECEISSWDTLWKWLWFSRDTWMSEYWKKTELALKPLLKLLPEFQVKSILDCSCGLGFKTILFVKGGYDVEGADASPMAIKYAPQLARELGLKIHFFLSTFEELPSKTQREYDCVYSDYFDELETEKELLNSARGIYSVLKKGGKFIFCSPSPELKKSELNKLIEMIWEERERFKIEQPVEHYGLKMTHIKVRDKTSEGILENNIFLIEEGETMRAEIAPIMNPRIKWTYSDYKNILKETGFSKVEYIKREENEACVIEIK